MVRRGGIASAAALLSLLAALSALLGLGRDVVIAAVFGAGSSLDAYLVAQGLMNVVLGLAASAMAKASVPVISRGVAHGEVAAAHRTAMVTLTVTTVVLALGSIVMVLAVGPVVDVLAPGFGPADQAQAEQLTRVILIATVLVAGTNLLAAVAQSHRRFFWAGVQGVPFNVVMIVAAAAFGPRFGIVALAGGYVAGSAARLACQLVPLRQIGVRLAASFDVRDRGFREIVVLVPALLLGSAISNVNTLVDRAVGSTIGEGTISALNYGWRVAAVAHLLLVTPLVTAIYPAFGAAVQRVDLAALVQRGTSTMAVILTPVAIASIIGATPVITVLFARGSFDDNDVRAAATALACYAPAVVLLGWREIVSRAFYSVGDARWPVVVAVGAMVVNLVGDLTLGRRFGIPGLALSTTLSIGSAAVASTILLARRHDAVRLDAVAASIGRLAVAAAASIAAALVVARWVGDDEPSETVRALLDAAAVGLTVVVVYVGALVVMRAPELHALRAAGRSLLRRRDGADRAGEDLDDPTGEIRS